MKYPSSITFTENVNDTKINSNIKYESAAKKGWVLIYKRDGLTKYDSRRRIFCYLGNITSHEEKPSYKLHFDNQNAYGNVILVSEDNSSIINDELKEVQKELTLIVNSSDISD